MDDALLGWAFPKGQISLWLDTNEFIGVTSTIGILYTEVRTSLIIAAAVMLTCTCAYAHGE